MLCYTEWKGFLFLSHQTQKINPCHTMSWNPHLSSTRILKIRFFYCMIPQWQATITISRNQMMQHNLLFVMSVLSCPPARQVNTCTSTNGPTADGHFYISCISRILQEKCRGCWIKKKIWDLIMSLLQTICCYFYDALGYLEMAALGMNANNLKLFALLKQHRNISMDKTVKS